MRTDKPDFEPGTLNAYVVSPAEVQDGDVYGYKVVAVVHVGFPAWSVYRGPTTWSDARVAAEGDIIGEEAASLLFPALANSGRGYYL